MLFNSLEYLLFLPLVAIIYFVVNHRYRWVVLLIASYIFYISWRVDYAALILFSTCIDYWAGLKMASKLDKKSRKPFLYLSLLANLGLLFSFKYLSFFNESLRTLLGWTDIEYPIDEFSILLPVGISFYTFQTLSYTIDVYRGNKTAEKHFGIFALYVSFFPQLVAGPIERSTTFLPQFYIKHFVDWQRIIDGVKLIVWGLFKKMVIGDNLAIFVAYVYGSPDAYSGNILILATLAFTVQVYADGSGYTDIAIGSAKVLGFKLSDNYNRPFFATSIARLWRRWHITLTTWINDYFYTPLNNRTKTKTGRYRNIVIVMVVVGLWHGAGWQFVFFGLLHAANIILFRATTKQREQLNQWLGLNNRPLLKRNLGIGLLH